jgi:ribokinase
MPSNKFEVVCVGSATIDCFVRIPCDFNQIKHGSKVLIDDIDLQTGGGATNVAVGISRLGLKTGFIGELGEDLDAHMIKHDLQKERVSFLVNQHSRHHTAYSVVLEAKGKDRAILVYKGASSFLHPNEIPKDLKTGWFYFASVTGESFNTMERIAAYAKRNNINVYYNPSSYMTEKGRGFMKKILASTTILALNREEAEMLVKANDYKGLLKGLHTLGPQVCIITDGSRGVHAFDGNTFYHHAAKKLKAVDTTGAGDAFGAGFLAGFIIAKDKPLEKRIVFAIRLGMANAESVVMRVGAKPGLLTRKMAASLMN